MASRKCPEPLSFTSPNTPHSDIQRLATVPASFGKSISTSPPTLSRSTSEYRVYDELRQKRGRYVWKPGDTAFSSSIAPHPSHKIFLRRAISKAASSPITSNDTIQDVLLDEDESGSKLGESEAVITIVNTVVGVILLQLPFAMHLSGLAGALTLVIVTVVMGYTASLIGTELSMLDDVAEEQQLPVDSRDLGWIAFMAFGDKGKWFVSILFGAELYLAAIAFLLMSAENIAKLCGVDMQIAIAFVAIVCALLQAFLAVDPERCMRMLAHASSISVTSLVITALSLISTGMIGASTSGLPKSDYTIFSSGLPRALGIMLFVFAGHPCIPQIYYAMSDASESFLPAVKKSFGISCGIYLFVGLGGYLLFGSGIAQNFVANIGTTAAGKDIAWMAWLRIFAQVALTVKIIGTFPIIAEPVMSTILTTSAYGPSVRVLQRLVFAGITAVVGIILKDSLASISAIAGGLLTMSTSVLFPCAAFLKLANNISKTQRFTCYLCLILGVVGLIFCTAFSGLEIVCKSVDAGTDNLKAACAMV